MSADTFPQYIRIAYFLASRIAEGDFPIGKRLSGRSKLSSEYQVSPETMRRALQILADMKVVEVKGQSGVYVLSTDNARRCAENLRNTDRREKAAKLRHLLEEHDETGGGFWRFVRRFWKVRPFLQWPSRDSLIIRSAYPKTQIKSAEAWPLCSSGRQLAQRL